MTDILIIGGGPAGVSASLYTTRAGLQTAIIAKDDGALGKAETIENFYGHAEPISGKALVEAGWQQAKRLGVSLITAEVVNMKLEDFFTINTAEAAYEAKIVILATGAARTSPPIKGIQAYEGRGVSYCAVCDAFFYRGKDVAVLGGGAYALSEVQELLPLAKSVTVLSNGESITVDFPAEVPVITEPITELTGGSSLEGVTLADGRFLAVKGVFVALGIAGSTDLARKIGAFLNGNHIAVDDALRTSVPGLFAAGDCTGGMKQIAKAAYEGALAGMEAVKYARANPL